MNAKALRVATAVALYVVPSCSETPSSSVTSGSANAESGATGDTDPGGQASSAGGGGSAGGVAISPWKNVWVRTFPGEGRQTVTTVIDKDGNVVAAGRFIGTLEIDGTTYTSDTEAAFAAKLDPAGDLLWATVFDGDGHHFITGLAVGNDGSIAISGVFDETIDLGNGPLLSEGSEDSFLTRLAPDGSVLWAVQMGGANGDQELLTLAIDAGDDLIVAGRFESSFSLSGAVLDALDGRDGWAAKYSKDGQLTWARQFGGMGDQQVDGAVTDSGSGIVLTGHFEEEIEFDDASLSGAPFTGFFAKIAGSNGSRIWAHTIDTTQVDAAVRPDDFVMLSGVFTESLVLGDQIYDGDLTPHTFFALCDKDGVIVKGKAYGETKPNLIPHTSFTGDETVMIVPLHGTTELGGVVHSSVGDADILLVAVDDDWEYRWSQQFGGSGEDRGRSAFGPLGELVLAGSFRDSVDFGGKPVTAVAESDGFVAKFER